MPTRTRRNASLGDARTIDAGVCFAASDRYTVASPRIMYVGSEYSREEENCPTTVPTTSDRMYGRIRQRSGSAARISLDLRRYSCKIARKNALVKNVPPKNPVSTNASTNE